MTIKFHSEMEQGGEKNKVEFVAEGTVTKEMDFDVFEFKEPQQGIMNRIEVSDKVINIFAGTSTINLELDKILKIEYNTPAGVMYLSSLLISLKKIKDGVNFEYTISSGNNEVGRYNLTLTSSK